MKLKNNLKNIYKSSNLRNYTDCKHPFDFVVGINSHPCSMMPKNCILAIFPTSISRIGLQSFGIQPNIQLGVFN